MPSQHRRPTGPNIPPCHFLLGAAVLLWLTCDYAFAQASASRLELESQRVRAALTAEAHGAIASLVDKRTGRELIASQSRPLLFQLEFTESPASDAKRFSLTNWDAGGVQFVDDASGAISTRHVVFSKFGERSVEVRCCFQAMADDPLVRCRIELSFDEPIVLEKVEFPVVTLRAEAAENAGDAVVLGATKGGLHRHPSTMKPGQEVSAAQPGSLAAQFGCWYDRQVGLYTAALDSRGYRKSVAFRRTTEGLAMSWTLPAFDELAYKQDFDVVLTTFHGADEATPPDWRDAAGLYKAWAVGQPWCAKTFAARDDVPAWLRQGPAMVRFNRGWLAEPTIIKSWLQEYWRRYYPDLPPLVIAYWGWEKVGDWVSPDYFPLFPSDEQFRDVAEFGRALGGHAFPWPSGYRYALMYDKQSDGTFRWDNRKHFNETARAHAVHNRDGGVFLASPPWVRGGQNACMCPGDPWTIEWFNGVSTELAIRGAEMIQVDQIVGGNFPACYRKEHGHPPGPGPWSTDVFRTQLKTMLAECRKIQPDAVVCFEEPNEHFIQQVGIQDYRDWEALKQPATDPASVFNYLYHEYLPVFQSNPQAGNRLLAAWCLADGQIPHLIPSKSVVPGPLLENAGFEKGNARIPDGWHHVGGFQDRKYLGDASRDSVERHDGNVSLRLSNTKADDIAQVAQNLFVCQSFAAGKTYQLSAWLKTKDVGQAGAIALGALAQPLKHLGSWQIPMPPPSAGWTQCRVRFTLPAGTEFLRIMLNLNGKGVAWIDSIRLDELRDDGTLAEVQRSDLPADHAFMQMWVQLFHGPGRPYLALGRFLRPPKLECGVQVADGRRLPAIFHNAFAAPDGSEAVILVNATAAPQSSRLTWQDHTGNLSFAPWEARLVTAEAWKANTAN